jgi:hypothetical protein
MSILTVKKDENLFPLWAKLQINVLGKHEYCFWSKSDRYVLVLHGNSLHFHVSMAVNAHRPLCQGNCKNAFCQGILPGDKIAIVCPPPGNPEAKPNEYWLLRHTLYGLRCSPQHWYDKITKILKSIGLTPSLKDPCLFAGFVTDPYDPSTPAPSTPLSLGLYVDDFVYFSADPAADALLCHLLAERCKVDFMGLVKWFLGIHFSWHITLESVTLHLNQSGFVANLVKRFS